jgi:hypothetical protein
MHKCMGCGMLVWGKPTNIMCDECKKLNKAIVEQVTKKIKS